MLKRIIILGCTGSIGQSTCQVVNQFKDSFTVTAISAHSNVTGLLKIQKDFNVSYTALSGEMSKDFSPHNNKVDFSGTDGLIEMIHAVDADIVVNGISGAAGLLPSIAALESGKDLVLANKETVVMANSLIFDLAKKHNRSIIPVDSEHSAILQLVRFRPENFLNKIVLTASGGPFKDTPQEAFSTISPEDAMKHPTWDMGRKISIDSATLANKGLEVIETHMFFNTPPSKIDVVIHPQSIIHSMISTTDGCMYAQLSSTDMQIPIMNALSYPAIAHEVIAPFDPAGLTLTFEKPQIEKFPMLLYAYDSLEYGGAYTIAYNAANEIAVDQFVNRRIKFTDIPIITNKILQYDWSKKASDFEEVIAIDQEIRKLSMEIISKL